MKITRAFESTRELFRKLAASPSSPIAQENRDFHRDLDGIPKAHRPQWRQYVHNLNPHSGEYR